MSVIIDSKPIRWAAQAPHVREVLLLGTADFAFWKDRLAMDDLQPAEKEGRAQLLINAGEWAIRADATHAKSKTYTRAEAEGW